METEEIKKLRKLNKELIENGCNNFFISGISKGLLDDVFCLNKQNGTWIIFYTERGKNEDPIYLTNDLDEVINYYKNYIMKIDHWHLIISTRSYEKIIEYKKVLEKSNIKTIENNIPAYKSKNDYVYRLFVLNKSIFEAKKIFDNIPYNDL